MISVSKPHTVTYYSIWVHDLVSNGATNFAENPFVCSGSDSPANAQLLVSKENQGLPPVELDALAQMLKDPTEYGYII